MKKLVTHMYKDRGCEQTLCGRVLRRFKWIARDLTRACKVCEQVMRPGVKGYIPMQYSTTFPVDTA